MTRSKYQSTMNKLKAMFHGSHAVSKSQKPLKPSTKQKTDGYNFTPLYLAFFSIYLGRTLLMPTLKFYADSIQLYYHSESGPLMGWQHGVLNGLFYITYATGALAYGPLSSRYGRRKVLLFCLFGMTVGFLLQAFAFNFWMLVAARTFAGLFAAISGVVQIYLADVVKPAHLPKYTSRVGLIYGLVWGLGPLCAVLIAVFAETVFEDWNERNPTVQWRTGIIVGAAITSATLVYCYFYLEESLPHLANASKKKENAAKPKFGARKNSVNLEDATKKDASVDCYGEREELSHNYTASEKEMEDMAIICESMLPAKERTPEFKRRLRRLIVGAIVLAFICEFGIGAHCGVYPLLHDGVDGYVKWEKIEFGVVWTLWGLSYSSCNLFYVRLQSKLGPFMVIAVATVCAVVSNVAIPLLAKHLHNWAGGSPLMGHAAMQLLAMAPASIISGVGYGLGISATQTVIADFSRRYDIRKVSQFLSNWMFAVAMGASFVLVQLWLCDCLSCAGSFFVTAAVSAVGTILAVYCAHSARDIAIAVDFDSVIENDNKLTAEIKNSGRMSSMQLTDDENVHGTIAELRKMHQQHSDRLLPGLTPTPVASNNNLNPENLTLSPFNLSAAMRLAALSTPMGSDPRDSDAERDDYDEEESSGGALCRALTLTRESVRRSMGSFSNVALPNAFIAVTPAMFVNLPLDEDGDIFEVTALEDAEGSVFALPPTIDELKPQVFVDDSETEQVPDCVEQETQHSLIVEVELQPIEHETVDASDPEICSD